MLKQLVVIFLMLLTTLSVYADEQTKILLHMNDTFKLTHLQNSVKNIRKELGDDVKIQIIINGKAVQLMLKNDLASAGIINEILKNNADIGLCHNAIRNNRVDKNMLIEGLRVLPTDGNVSVINLQKEGYIYIKI